MDDVKTYDNLINFLLGPVRKRPALFLGRPEISHLPNFILGYSVGFEMAKSTGLDMDKYFGKNGFLSWYFDLYPERFSSFWTDSFLEEAGNDETLALEIFFEYLEKFRQFIIDSR